MVGRKTLLELRRYLEDFRPADALTDNLFVDQDGGPLTTHAVQCVLSRLKRKLGLKRLSAHQFRRTWATNFRRTGVGDLYDLQLEGGWGRSQRPTALLRRRRRGEGGPRLGDGPLGAGATQAGAGPGRAGDWSEKTSSGCSGSRTPQNVSPGGVEAGELEQLYSGRTRV
jgi:hypothetical protein